MSLTALFALRVAKYIAHIYTVKGYILSSNTTASASKINIIASSNFIVFTIATNATSDIPKLSCERNERLQ